MVGAPNSPREDRIKALLIMAETVISRTDDEKGNRDWKGRSEVLAAIALLASVERSAWGEQRSDALRTQLGRLKYHLPFPGWLKKDTQLTQ